MLSALACPACGALVAIAREATTPCAHCGRAVAVPQAYRDALVVADREVEADALTREAFRTLGEPPSWWLVFVDTLTTGFAAGTATTVVTFIVAVHTFDWILDRSPDWFHVNLWDWLSRPEEELLLWGSTFATLLTLFVLGAFGRRRARGLQKLHKALAARPPAREGGPEGCRECGAPLTVPKNALGVRCPYCRADNLVAIPATWLSRARGSAARVAREARDALREHRVELRRLRLRLAVRFALIAGAAVLLLTSVVRRVFAGDRGAFDLRAALSATPRRLFDAQPRATMDGAPGPAAPRVPADGCAATYRLERGEDMSCVDGDCAVGWFIALRRGETLEAASTPGGNARLFVHTGDRGWNEAYGRSDLWGNEVAHDAIGSERRARLEAPSTSWYRVTLELHGVDQELRVCAEVHR